VTPVKKTWPPETMAGDIFARAAAARNAGGNTARIGIGGSPGGREADHAILERRAGDR
jgi:hypothetical protein